MNFLWGLLVIYSVNVTDFQEFIPAVYDTQAECVEAMKHFEKLNPEIHVIEMNCFQGTFKGH